jgi:hypothetical protein
LVREYNTWSSGQGVEFLLYLVPILVGHLGSVGRDQYLPAKRHRQSSVGQCCCLGWLADVVSGSSCGRT